MRLERSLSFLPPTSHSPADVISLPGELHGALTQQKWKVQQKVKPRAKPLSPPFSAEKQTETHKNHLPPPLLTDVQAALLYFSSLQREGGALREGERTGTRGQHGDEGQKLKVDQ